MEENTAEYRRKQLSPLNILKTIISALVFSFAILWVVLQLILTIYYDPTMALLSKILGLPLEVIAPEEYTDPQPADKIFSDLYFTIVSVVTTFAGIAGTYVLTKRRSVFSAIGLMFAFILPRERENWGSIKDKETGDVIPSAIVRVYEKDAKGKNVLLDETVTDLDGHYRLDFRTTNPNSFINVSASGYRVYEKEAEYIPIAKGTYQIVQDISLSVNPEEKALIRVSYSKLKVYNFFMWFVFIVSILFLLSNLGYFIAYPTSWYGAIIVVVCIAAVVWNIIVMRQRFSRSLGRILDSYTKQPINGAFVTLFSMEKKRLGLEITTKEGVVRFNYPKGGYFVTVQKTGYSKLESKDKVPFVAIELSDEGHIKKDLHLRPTAAEQQNTNKGIANPFSG